MTMTVKELISKLGYHDPDMPVLVSVSAGIDAEVAEPLDRFGIRHVASVPLNRLERESYWLSEDALKDDLGEGAKAIPALVLNCDD